MNLFLNDAEINDLIAQSKRVDMTADEIILSLKERPRYGHKEADIDMPGRGDDEFRLILRQNTENSFDFSVILGYRNLSVSKKLFHLRRYNGKSHEHTNKIEKEKFYGFHVHIATEKYQREGLREDEYAEKDVNYSNIKEALSCMIKDCNIIVKENPQMTFEM